MNVKFAIFHVTRNNLVSFNHPLISKGNDCSSKVIAPSSTGLLMAEDAAVCGKLDPVDTGCGTDDDCHLTCSPAQEREDGGHNSDFTTPQQNPEQCGLLSSGNNVSSGSALNLHDVIQLVDKASPFTSDSEANQHAVPIEPTNLSMNSSRRKFKCRKITPISDVLEWCFERLV